MRRSSLLFIKNNRGMNLIEVLMAMGIFGITLGALSSQMVDFVAKLNEVENEYSASSVSSSINKLVSNMQNCTVSAEGVTLVPNGVTSINRLHFGEAQPSGVFTKSADSPFTRNQVLGKIRINDMGFRVKQKVSDTPPRYIADFFHDLSAENTRKPITTQPVSVVLSTDAANAIQSCSSITQSSDKSMEDIACQMASQWKSFDPATQTCSDRAYEEQWHNGDRNTATCPAGWTIYPGANPYYAVLSCKTKPPENWAGDSKYVGVTRTYTSGMVRNVGPQYMIPSTRVTPNGCKCNYASDLNDSAGFICRVRCYRFADIDPLIEAQ